MKNKKGTIFMFVGLLCLAAALFLTIYNIYDGKRAEKASLEVLPKVEEAIDQAEETQWKDDIVTDREMPAVEIDGYRYVGILEIAALDLRLPVMQEWDYDRLKTAPCRYSGSVYQDNMIIAGHNYVRHFSAIKNLPVGTEIVFTDVEGNAFSYTLAWIDVLEETQTEELTEGDWDLTLFTCTYGGESRYVVRCVKITQ